MMRWSPVRCAPILLVLALAACGGGESANETAPEPVATIRSEAATEGITSDTVTLYGTAEAGPGNERALAVQAEASLVRIVAPTGTAVRAGDVIAVLRPTPAARLETARTASDAAAAQAAYARAQRLRADGLVSDADVETARAAAATAAAARLTTAQRTASLELRASVAGTVQALTARPGDVIAAGTAVATIAAGGALRARFGVDPALAQRIHPGQPIRLGAVGADQAVAARVAGVDPQVDATTRLAAVFAQLPAASGFGAGEALRGRIALGATSGGLTIPYAALLDDGGRSYVFVVERGVARARDVAPGNSAGDRIRILRGLRPGERVVTEGATALDDGMKVRDAAAGPAR